MIVCICRGASDRQIRKALEGGATCLGQLQAAGIGDRCGACAATLHALLAKHEIAEGMEQSCLTCPNQRRLAT